MKNQRGATLAITLLILFIITLLGVSSIQVTQMQEKMSANIQDKEFSFNAAESALAAGEAWLTGLSREPSVQLVCTSHPCVKEPYQNVNLATQSTEWWQSNSGVYNERLDNVTSPPRYIIEFLEFVPDTPATGDSSIKSPGSYYYQITARGTGATSQAVSVLQTTYARRF